jgi:hypothetical protein
MEDQYLIAPMQGIVVIDAAERMMLCARDTLARVLVALADVDQDGAAAHEFGRPFGSAMR